MDRKQYVAASERVLEEAKRRAETYVGPCSECRYSYFSFAQIERACSNPLVELASRNQTNAYASERIVTCSQQRDQSSTWGPVVCGPDGTLFEPKREYLGLTLGWWAVVVAIATLIYFFFGPLL